MTHSLCRLFVSLFLVGFLTLSIPRVTPPGGLIPFDYLLMCCLPVGAYIAGKHWHNGPAFLIYGTIGMLAFIPGYLANGRLGIRLAYDQWSAVRDVIAWTIAVPAVAIVYNMAGRAGKESAVSSASEFDAGTD